jgi:hypothetical protein
MTFLRIDASPSEGAGTPTGPGLWGMQEDPAAAVQVAVREKRVVAAEPSL